MIGAAGRRIRGVLSVARWSPRASDWLRTRRSATGRRLIGADCGLAAPDVVLPSWSGAMIRVQGTGGPIVQLRLEMAESLAPAVALWELLGEEQRRTAMALLAALIAQTVSGEQNDAGELAGE